MVKRSLLTLLFLLIVIAHSSCGTRKYASESANMEEFLTQKMGLTVTSDDNVPLYAAASEWLGTPHRYGGSSKKGIDCSGFVSVVYQKVYGLSLAASSQGMLTSNCTKIKKEELQEGDLVFFKTGRRKSRTTNHVGIYLKDGKFVHTSTSQGVVVSSLDDPYYTRTWVAAGRVDI